MPLAQASLVHRLVVPFPAGGSLDMAARLLATELGQRTGDTFLVENRPGADGLLGARAVLRYAGSGQALLMINPSLISAELQGALDFDPLQAFQPVAHLADTEVLWVARADLPVASAASRTMRDIRWNKGLTGWARIAITASWISRAKRR